MDQHLIYSGKAKDVYQCPENPQQVILVFKDQATMLNGARKVEIKGKGVLNNQISSLIFQKLNEVGIPTHFLRQLSPSQQLTQKVQIIPLEVVLRNYLAGSLAKRLGVEEGQKLETPIVEFYYKNDALNDPFINDEHVRFLGIATTEEIAEIKRMTHIINGYLQKWFAQIGLTLIDFKLEFGKDFQGKIVLADEFSPDNCRLWDAQGQHFDKDVFRRDLGNLTEVYQEVWERLQKTLV